jgi:hypothetical protein
MFGKRKPALPIKPRIVNAPSVHAHAPGTNLDQALEFDTNAYEKALDAHVGERYEKERTQQMARARLDAPSVPERPTSKATELIAKIPKDLSLIHVYSEYPRVLNKIASTWGNPREFYPYIDSLLMDSRGGRQGFPFAVARELNRLAQHYEQFVTRRPGGNWDVTQRNKQPLY